MRSIPVSVDDEQAVRAQPGPRLGVDPAREARTDNGDVQRRFAYSWYSSGTVSSPP
jgi:hypothetical protein